METALLKLKAEEEKSKVKELVKDYSMAAKAAYRIFKANRPKVKITITK